jgi:hypothetical protein
MEVKVFLVPLVHAPSRAGVEAAMHALGKRRFEGLSDRDKPARCDPRVDLFHR